MRCDDLDDLIEAVAEGEVPPEPAAAHLATCARCQSEVAAARALDRLLASRETPEPPATFTARVMDRVGHEQWRAEQWVDVGFNVAVAAGVTLILGSLAGLAWWFGWLTLDRPTVQAVAAAIEPWVASTVARGQTVALAAALLTSALGLWWWVEGEASW